MVAIFIWVSAAGVAIFYSWSEGITSAPPSGQDVYLSEIKEKESIEKNMKNPPELSVPSLRDLQADDRRSDLPDLQDVLPEKKSENTLPPYISEKETPDDTGAFLPRKESDPELRRLEKPKSNLPEIKDSGNVKGGLLPP